MLYLGFLHASFASADDVRNAAHSPLSPREFTFRAGSFWSILQLMSLLDRALEINSGTQVSLQQWCLWPATRKNQEMKTVRPRSWLSRFCLYKVAEVAILQCSTFPASRD